MCGKRIADTGNLRRQSGHHGTHRAKVRVQVNNVALNDRPGELCCLQQIFGASAAVFDHIPQLWQVPGMFAQLIEHQRRFGCRPVYLENR